MITIHDLEQMLDAHAPQLDHDLAARPRAVAGRVRAVRRRRTAAGATLAAAVIAGGTWFAVTGPQGEDRPGPGPVDAPSSTDGTVRAEVSFAPEAGGYTLRASELADPGVREFNRSTVLPADVQFAVHCTSSVQVDSGPRMPWVTVEVLGWQVLQVSCGKGGAPDDDPATYLYGPAAEDGAGLTGTRTAADGTERERHFAAGRNITFTVRLTDEDGRPYGQPIDDVELGIGIYGR